MNDNIDISEIIDQLISDTLTRELLQANHESSKYFFRLKFSDSEIEKKIICSSFLGKFSESLKSENLNLTKDHVVLVSARGQFNSKDTFIPEEQFGVYDSDSKKGFVYYRNNLGLGELENKKIAIFIENGSYSDRQSIKDLNQINENSLFNSLLKILGENSNNIFPSIKDEIKNLAPLNLLLTDVRSLGTASLLEILKFLYEINKSLSNISEKEYNLDKIVGELLPHLSLYKDTELFDKIKEEVKFDAGLKKVFKSRIRLNSNMAMGLDNRRHNWSRDSYSKHLDSTKISYEDLIGITDKSRLWKYDLAIIYPGVKKQAQSKKGKNEEIKSFDDISRLIEKFKNDKVLSDEEADSFLEQTEEISSLLDEVLETKGLMGIQRKDAEDILEFLNNLEICIKNSKDKINPRDSKKYLKSFNKICKTITRAKTLSDGETFKSKIAFEILKTLESNKEHKITEIKINVSIPLAQDGQTLDFDDDIKYFIGSSVLPFLYSTTSLIRQSTAKIFYLFKAVDNNRERNIKSKDIYVSIEVFWNNLSKANLIEWVIDSESLYLWRRCSHVARIYLANVKNEIKNIEYSFGTKDVVQEESLEDWQIKKERKIEFEKFQEISKDLKRKYQDLCKEIKEYCEYSFINADFEESKSIEYIDGDIYYDLSRSICEKWKNLSEINLENASKYGVFSQKFANALLFFGAVFFGDEQVFISSISPLSIFRKIVEEESVKSLIDDLVQNKTQRIHFVQNDRSLSELITTRQFPAYLHYDKNLYLKQEGDVLDGCSRLSRFRLDNSGNNTAGEIGGKTFSQSVSRIIRKYLGVYPFSVYSTDLYFKGITDHSSILDVIKQIQQPFIDKNLGTSKSYLVSIINDSNKNNHSDFQDRIHRAYRDDLSLQHTFLDQGYESVKIGFSNTEEINELPLKNKNFAILFKPEHENEEPEYDNLDNLASLTKPQKIGLHFKKLSNVEAHGPNTYISLNAGYHDHFIGLTYLLSYISKKANPSQDQIGNKKTGFQYKFLRACIKSTQSLEAIQKLSEKFHWVILYDNTLEKSTIKNQFGSKNLNISEKIDSKQRDISSSQLGSKNLNIIEYRSGLKDNCAIVVLSQEGFSDFSEAISSSISKIDVFKNDKKKTTTKTIIEQAMKISGSILLKAAGKGKFLQEMLGIVCTKRLFDSVTFLSDSIASGWVYIDDYSSEWSLKNRPDLLYYRLTDECLEIYCIEVKFRDDSCTKKTVNDATIQVCSALQLLTRTFTSKKGLIDQKIWIRHIFKALQECIDSKCSPDAVESLRKKEYEFLESVQNNGSIKPGSVKIFGVLTLFSHKSLAEDADKDLQHIMSSANSWKTFLPPSKEGVIKLRNSEANVDKFDLEGAILELRFSKDHIKSVLDFGTKLELNLDSNDMNAVDILESRLMSRDESDDDESFVI